MTTLEQAIDGYALQLIKIFGTRLDVVPGVIVANLGLSPSGTQLVQVRVQDSVYVAEYQSPLIVELNGPVFVTRTERGYTQWTVVTTNYQVLGPGTGGSGGSTAMMWGSTNSSVVSGSWGSDSGTWGS